LFRSPDQKRLDKHFYKIERTIRKQLKKDALSEASVTIGHILKVTMAALIAFSVLVAMVAGGEEAARRMVNMMISLQFIVF